MKWFQHDTDASTDAKVKKLILRHGAVGYAVYFHCLELIAGTITMTNINFELEHDAEIIADNLKIQGDKDIAGIDKVNNIMRTIIKLGLFEESENRIFCFQLAKRLDNTVSRSPEISKIKEATKKLRSNYVEDTKKLGADEITSDEIILNERKESKPKKRFSPPSLKEVQDYFILKTNNSGEAERFVNFYESKGWLIGKNKMVDWKAAVRNWISRNKKEGKKYTGHMNPADYAKDRPLKDGKPWADEDGNLI